MHLPNNPVCVRIILTHRSQFECITIYSHFLFRSRSLSTSAAIVNSSSFCGIATSTRDLRWPNFHTRLKNQPSMCILPTRGSGINHSLYEISERIPSKLDKTIFRMLRIQEAFLAISILTEALTNSQTSPKVPSCLLTPTVPDDNEVLWWPPVLKDSKNFKSSAILNVCRILCYACANF